MTYYDRIQNTINHIENHLTDEINTSEVAHDAYMSIATLYRMFFALTGYSVKQYIRLRRINEAIKELETTSSTILDIALNYGFSTHASFTKAIKKYTGNTPTDYRKQSIKYKFERINIMDKYVDVKEIIDEEKYPGVKVLKDLKPIRVAYYCYYGENPEDNAFKIMGEWFKQSELDIEKNKIRVFGFNNPSPTEPDQKEYGYEVWVTIDEDYIVKDDLVKAKTFDGGKYAVCGVQNFNPKGEGIEIMQAWQKLNVWLKDSSFTYDTHQWLEEHTGFTTDLQHIGGIDLYMPIQKIK